jgi:ribosomal protein S18 acetylase RimI-like enzyme
MEILKGNEKHIGACLSIARELRQYFTDAGITTMSKDLRNHLLYVAVESNEVRGFVTIQRKNDQIAEISWMAVKLDYQHQGIGSALIDHVTNDLRSQKIRLLEVKTLSDAVEYHPYEITRRFFKKMGFIHLETIDPYPEWEPGNPCAIYVKIL